MCPEYPGVTILKHDLATTPKSKAKPAKVEYLHKCNEDEENQNKMLVSDPLVTISPLVSPGPHSSNNLLEASKGNW
ncbi:hypothetical protein JVT61DRAFT_3302 [Boletus reticuloceps]|uniref:Uncharacterized protein n=1 Tax=Boletus reticuloceps TaxID=495285 RepID=A0A8I3A9G8_9AGAM|nr:hypothetical protein JVT61DRAFT_3302 [Boletus reticuloceps]